MTKSDRFEVVKRSVYEDYQRNHIFKKGSKQRGSGIQREFLHLVEHGGEDFCDALFDLGVETGKSVLVPTEKMSSAEYIEMPWSTEDTLYRLWHDLPPSQASCPEMWVRINLELIREGIIDATYLAREGGLDGKSKIVSVLNSSSGDVVDSCVRRVFRRLGGIYHDRGKRSSFIDCPMARAWWRHRYAIETREKFPEHTARNLSDALRTTSAWSILIEAMVTRLTVVGAISIRSTLVHLLRNTEKSEIRIKEIVEAVGRRCVVQALPALTTSQVLEIVQRDIVPTIGWKNSTIGEGNASQPS